MSITVKQDAFEGPLDLLLHLIEKNKMDIYDIQIAPITDQYMEYIEGMGRSKQHSLEEMSEFIVMASTLLYIKSKMLLPKPKLEEAEEDPRQELVQRLLEYKKMKYISEELKQYEQDAQVMFFRNSPIHKEEYSNQPVPVGEVLGEVTFTQIYEIFNDIMKRKDLVKETKINIDYNIMKRDSYTIKEKSKYILDLIQLHETITFYGIFKAYTTKIEMIVTFMALLELVNKNKIKIYQKDMLSNIWISGVSMNESSKN